MCTFALGILTLTAPLHAATIRVAAGGSLQAAIDAANGGDVILLEPGVTYVGNFVLRNKPDLTTPIVIRTAGADADLPLAGVRITPAYAPRLAKIKSPNSSPAMRTATGAHHWTLLLLEFQANLKGYGEVIAFGAGDSTQTALSQVPHSLVIDRVYLHGDPLLGQKRGIALHSRDTAIVNSHVSDCKAIAQDSQAISGYNGPGSYLIENNYLEGAGENFMIGGADPPIQNLVPANIVFRRNHLRKPLEWRNPILAGAVNVTAQPMGGGMLPAGTYFYKVVARRAAGQTNKATSGPSAQAAVTVGAAGAAAISWSPVSGAQDYLVYGRNSGSQNVYWTTTVPSFIDTGAAGSAGTPPTATKWSVKNHFELKSGQDVLIEGNVFENLWIADQPGYPIVFTPRNQSGRAPWTVVQRITFRRNLVRHTPGGINILGADNLQPSQRTNHITIENNLFEDMTSAIWGSGSRFATLGGGPDSITIDHNTVITTTSSVVWLYGGTVTAPTAATNFTYTNNMSHHNVYGINGNGFSSGLSALNAYTPGAVVTHNVLAGGTPSRYPPGGFFPSTAEWQAQFADYDAGDFRLRSGSVFRSAGSDGADLGANFDLLVAETHIALTGHNSGSAGAPQRPIIAPWRPGLERPVTTDFTGDGRADLAVFRPQNGYWYIGDRAQQFGIASDIPVAADYNGDRRAEIAVFRPQSGLWYFEGRNPKQFGRPGDIPVPADYDGDGRAEITVFRPLTNTWYIGDDILVQFGEAGDIPVPADYDGDGRDDVAVFRQSTGTWHIRGASVVQHGLPGDLPMPADYDGNGAADIAVFRPRTGEWIVLDQFTAQWGAPGDYPLTLDMDGDRRAELIVFRRGTGVWHTYNTAAGTRRADKYGLPGDVPVALRPQYRRQSLQDFDGDRRGDPAVMSDAGVWMTLLSSATYASSDPRPWGTSGDIAAPADYDGDHITDSAIYRPSTGYWYLGHSSSDYSTYQLEKWGIDGDVPVPGDYDGDGKADIAVWRPSTGWWFLGFSSTGFADYRSVKFGTSTDVPVPGDYDGDGKTDVAFYRPSEGTWYYTYSSANWATYHTAQFGVATDVPVPADYDGDGRTDVAVFRPSTGWWYLGWSSVGYADYQAFQFGTSSDVRVPADYDGDGRADIGSYRPSTGAWSLGHSTGGMIPTTVTLLGSADDTPVPHW